MSLDDYTGIREGVKQHPLDFIRENLERIPQSMKDQDVIDESVSDLTLADVYNYMSQIKTNQDLDLKRLTIDYVLITDTQKFAEICNYCGIYGVKYPSLSEGQRVYFIQSSDFATTLIPIELENGTLNIFMEPLDSSPDLITGLWAEHEDGERELRKELQNEKVETIKKNRRNELALKEPWEL